MAGLFGGRRIFQTLTGKKNTHINSAISTTRPTAIAKMEK
jgi:hypothetical protein